MRVAINGMGRIGRLLFRRLASDSTVSIVAVNDIMDPENLAYLLRYDSVYGTYDRNLEYKDGLIRVDGQPIEVCSEPDATSLPWQRLGVDVVLECSGKYSSLEAASAHLRAGADRVLLSTTGSDDVPLMIYGFNHEALEPEQRIISPGGCMTNCSVHLLSILQPIGIRTAHFNFVHSYTSRQELVDAPHAQFRRGRAAAESVIPVPIDLHHSLGRLLPALKGKIASVSTRVPVANGAMADLTVQLDRTVTVTEINELFRSSTSGTLQGIVGYTEEDLVSLDYKGNAHSCVVDGTLTSVLENQVKLIAWFDNEYGFTSRMIDWLHSWQ